MGAVPKDINGSFSDSTSFLKLILDKAAWKPSRLVCLQRGEDGRIGIKINVCQVNCGSKGHNTIITKVKPECKQINGELKKLDRILRIDNCDIDQLREDQITCLLGDKSKSTLELLVCSLESGNKRAFDKVSNASDRSLEMRKGIEKSRNKRIAKSNSVESEDEPLLMSGDQLSPIPCVDSGCAREEPIMRSLPCFTTVHKPPEPRYASLQTESVPSELLYVKGVDSPHRAQNGEIQDTDKKESRPLKSIASCFAMAPELLLKFPQFVRWDRITKSVDLTRGPKGNFGFSFKVKITKNPGELFTLVDDIVKDGPANGKLKVGDWIRSMNGQPLQTPQEAQEIPQMLAQETAVHIILQRPEGLSSNICSVKNNTRNNVVNTLPITEVATDRPTTSQKNNGGDLIHNRHKNSSASNTQRSTLGETVEHSRQNYSNPQLIRRGGQESKHRKGNVAPISNQGNMAPISNQIQQVSPGSNKENQLFSVFRVSNLDLNDSGSSSEFRTGYHTDPTTLSDQTGVDGVKLIFSESENDISDSMRSLQIKRTVCLSKVQVFLCGSEARALAKLLFPTVAPQFTDSGVNKLYHCVRCTMGMDKLGAISFRPWASLDHLLQNGETPSLHASNDSLSQSDMSKDRDEGNTFIHQGSVNVEFYIVPDEKFFHHCCQYLFTRTSIFILTFDGAKVLKSANAEIKHLENIIHTIRSFNGYECPILTYGLLSSDNSDLNSSAIDEVRTLFYLPYGHQIQKYNVPMPDLFCPCLADMESEDVTRQLQRSMWKVVMETVQKQQVIIPTVKVMQHLSEARGKGQHCITENSFAEMFQQCVPGGGQDVQQIVWTDLKNFGETLSSKAAPLTLPHLHHLDQLLFIEPEILLSSLQDAILHPNKVIQANEGDRPKWLKVLSTGIISQEDLLSMITPQSEIGEKIIQLLEIFGLIFRQNIYTDSSIQYLIPYFIPDQSHSDIAPRTDFSDTSVYLQFKAHMHVSSMLFYQMAFGLDAYSDTKNLCLLGSTYCTLHHMGYEISLHHHKLEDRIQITFTRTEKTTSKLCAIFQWLSKQCKDTLGSEVKYVLGPACPLNEQCSFSKQHQSDVHVLDLSKSQVLCGGVRVDNHKSVKTWIVDMPPRPILSLNRGTSIGSNDSMKSQPSPKLLLYVNQLPYTILKNVSIKLEMDAPLGNDWRGLAGLLGLTAETVSIYQKQKEPAMQLLLDFGRKQTLTVSRLLEHLSHPDMERADIVEYLKDWLNENS